MRRAWLHPLRRCVLYLLRSTACDGSPAPLHRVWHLNDLSPCKCMSCLRGVTQLSSSVQGHGAPSQTRACRIAARHSDAGRGAVENPCVVSLQRCLVAA